MRQAAAVGIQHKHFVLHIPQHGILQRVLELGSHYQMIFQLHMLRSSLICTGLGASKLIVAVGLKGMGEGVQVGSPGWGVLGARLGVGVKGEGVGLAAGAQAAKSARMSRSERAARNLPGISSPSRLPRKKTPQNSLRKNQRER